MKYVKFFTVLMLITIIALVGCERKVTQEIIKEISPADAAYLGSAACESCHSEKYASFIKSGHPYKLNDAADAQQDGYYPYTTVEPPSGYTWDDISKVIGGFWWKARFIDNEGFIITGPDVQYNFANDSWVAYHDGEVKPYACGPCHMTDYKATGNQEDLDGLVGTWEFNGIQCEECHGPGELHAANPFNIRMTIDRSSEQCGKCHIRGVETEIPAKGGFIKHHEQWNEMFTTKHQSLQCVDCHDVHESLHPNNPTRESAMKIDCESCHLDETVSFKASGIEEHNEGAPGAPTCIDCHMPRAAKSAVAVGAHEGDVRSHLLKINTSATAEMFSEDGSTANGYLTLEYTCLQCHTTEDKAWAATYAGQVHAPQASDGSDCFSCHGINELGPEVVAATAQWENSVHASGDNINRNRNSAGYYQSCEKCHSSEGFVAEVTGEAYGGSTFNAIGCFTCHDPHGEGTFALRVNDGVDLQNGVTYDKGSSNLCASCHQSRRDASTYITDDESLSSHWGPHYSNQADMLMGTNAYEYADFVYSNSAHTNTTTEGCIDCHFDEANSYNLGGHTFTVEDATYGEFTDGCNVDGCHNGALSDFEYTADADFDWDGSIESIHDEIEGLMDSIRVELIAANLLLYDAGDDEYHPRDTLNDVTRVVALADSAGALYNYIFVEDDRSDGIHNTAYTVGLLQSAINYLSQGDPSPVSGQVSTIEPLPSH